MNPPSTTFGIDYAAAWSSQDPDAHAAFSADDGVLKVNDGEPAVGRDAVRATAAAFMTAFPDMKVELVELKGEFPNIEFHWHWTGTNSGPDGTGASTFWINGQGVVQMEDQRIHCHACIMNFLALHADAKSLRDGITFVIDVTKGIPDEKIGNEKQLQNLWQGFPQRPQTIRIAGTNAVTRAFVNASIKLASVVTKQKVLDRIKFCTVDDAKKAIPLESAPRYVGGGAGGAESIASWIEARLKALPKPNL